MSTPLLPDALWNLIQPLLRPRRADPREADLVCRTVLVSPDDLCLSVVPAPDFSPGSGFSNPRERSGTYTSGL
jgi:hypothetical protein